MVFTILQCLFGLYLVYYVSKKYCPLLFTDSLFKVGQGFLDIQYDNQCQKRPNNFDIIIKTEKDKKNILFFLVYTLKVLWIMC